MHKIRSVQPTHITCLYLTCCHLIHYSSSRMWVLSSKTRRWRVGFESPPSKPMKPDPPKDHQNLVNSQAFQRVFQLDLTNFGDQKNLIWHRYTKSGDSRRDLGEKSLNSTKSLPDAARSHRILDGVGEISLIFDGFWWVSASLEIDAHLMENWPMKPDPLTGRLRVRHLATRSLTGWL